MNARVTPPAGVHPDALPPDFDAWDKEPSIPDHPLGTVAAIDYDTGLPIIKRKTGSSPQAVDPKPSRESKPAEPVEPIKPATPKPSGAQPVLKPASLAKGQGVSLRDGTAAKVAHVIDEKSVRVRTEAGKNTVVKRAEVTPHVLVKAHLRRMPGESK